MKSIKLMKSIKMMKNIKVLVLLFLSLICISAQQNDKINLREYVKIQIEKARLKNQKAKHILQTLPPTAKVIPKRKKQTTKNKESKNKLLVSSKTLLKQKTNSERYSKIENLGGSKNNVLLKFFILLEASLLASIIVVYRRKKISFEKQMENELKKNISKIRKEIYIPSNYSNENRKKLISGKLIDTKKKNPIIALAKKLSLSKGELFLAAKIKALTDSN